MRKATAILSVASMCVLFIFSHASAETNIEQRRAQAVERMRQTRKEHMRRVAEMSEAERGEYFRKRMHRREIANMERFAHEMARGSNPIRSIVLSEDMATVTFTYTNGTTKVVSVK